MADLSDGTRDGLYLDKQIADFFEEVVKMVGTKHIGKARNFQLADILIAGWFRDEEQNANAATIGRRDAGKLLQGDESGTLDSRQSYIGNHERPFPGFQLGQEHLRVGDEADTPSFGVQDLLDGTSTGGTIVENEDADVLRGGTSTHNTQYTLEAAERGVESSGCGVSGKVARLSFYRHPWGEVLYCPIT